MSNQAIYLPQRNGYSRPIDLMTEAAIAVLGIIGDTPNEIKDGLLSALDRQCESRTQEFFNLGQQKLDKLCELVMGAASHCGTSWSKDVINFVVSQLQQDGSRDREDALEFVREYVAALPWQLGWRAEVACPIEGSCPIRQMFNGNCPAESLEKNGEFIVTTESYRLKTKLESLEQKNEQSPFGLSSNTPAGLLTALLGGMTGSPFRGIERPPFTEEDDIDDMPGSIGEILRRM